MTITTTASPPRGKHQEMTPEEFLAAIPTLLDGTFCSARWMLDSFDVVRKGRERVFRFVPGRYPPGGADTRMVRCPACGKLSPRGIARDEPCLDCQDGQFVSRIEQYESDPVMAEMKEELAKRWWRSRPPSEVAAVDPGALLESRSGFSLASDVRDCASDQRAEEQAFAGNEPVTSDERPMGKGAPPREMLLQRLRWLLNPKESSTRARGSQIFLLGEDIKTLQAEIDYYHRRVETLGGEIAGRKLEELVMPSTRRIDNPHKKDRPFRRRKTRRKPRTSRRT
jgi:hypothetical protein